VDYINQARLILAKVNKICCFGSTNKNRYNFIAQYAIDYQLGVSKALFLKKGYYYEDYDKLLRHEEFYHSGVEPKDQEARLLFIKVMIHCVKTISLIYGYGNCAPLADIVFLEAIYRNLKPTYVRFINNLNKFIEELNVVVIAGEWPNPGCLIVSP